MTPATSLAWCCRWAAGTWARTPVEQIDEARHFAGGVVDEQPEWTLGESAPVLTKNAATLECRPWNVYDGGDHIIVVGEVIGTESTARVRFP